MSKEWLLIHRVRWYAWLPLTIYGSVVEIFMAVLGLGGTVYGLGMLTGLIPTQALPALTSFSALGTYAVFLAELACALFLAWSGVTGARAALLDMLAPALTFTGKLEQITVENRATKNSTYKVFVLAAAGLTWEIAQMYLANKFEFQYQVKPGRQLRLTYRRGTRLVTALSLGQTSEIFTNH